MGNKNLFKIAVLFSALSFLFSCGNLENPKDRNMLLFNDSITSVTDSVHAMNEIFLKSQNEIFAYGIDVDMNNADRKDNEFFLYINDALHSVHNVGIITDSLLYKSKLLEFIDSSERKRFVNLTLYLNKNHLSGARIESGKLIYFYRDNIYMADAQADLNRFVVFSNSKQEINLTRYKILDKRKNLYLLAYRKAKIWSND